MAARLAALCALLGLSSATNVTVAGRAILVDGEPFFVKGVCYSPIPIGQTPDFPPNGDYFMASRFCFRAFLISLGARCRVDSSTAACFFVSERI